MASTITTKKYAASVRVSAGVMVYRWNPHRHNHLYYCWVSDDVKQTAAGSSGSGGGRHAPAGRGERTPDRRPAGAAVRGFGVRPSRPPPLGPAGISRSDSRIGQDPGADRRDRG